MPVFDWIFIALLLVSFLLGVWRGLIHELLSLVSWMSAFVLAQWLAPSVSQSLPMGGASEMMRYAAGFVLVFVGVVFAVGLVIKLAKLMITSVGLRPIDRALGAIFGVLRGVVLLLTATVVILMTPLKSSQDWQDSTGAGIANAALAGLKPLLPQEFGKYLP
jgi:membrane protein required for colicin V production